MYYKAMLAEAFPFKVRDRYQSVISDFKSLTHLALAARLAEVRLSGIEKVSLKVVIARHHFKLFIHSLFAYPS